MTTAAELTWLDESTDLLLRGAEDDLARYFQVADFGDIPRTREELVLLLQALLDVYGPAVTEISLDWYGEIRPSTRSSLEPAVVVPEGSSQRLDRLSRYAAGLAVVDLGKTVRTVAGTLKQEILQGPRESLLQTADTDRTYPRFARVPRGAKTCAFCSMLASRGWVYRSADLAGGASHRYHNSCDCRIVPDWKGESLDGYDPDRSYSRYINARRAVEEEYGEKSPPDTVILERMRLMYPEAYTDGVGQPRKTKALLSDDLEALAQTPPEKDEKGTRDG